MSDSRAVRVFLPYAQNRQDGSVFALMYSLRLRSCRLMGAFLISPLPSFLIRLHVQQGPFAPRALPRFFTTTGPAATVSSSLAFPVSPVIRGTLLHWFPNGTRTVSPVAQHVLVTVLPLLPRRSDMPRRSVCAMPCCLRPTLESSAFGANFVEATYGFTFVAAR